MESSDCCKQYEVFRDILREELIPAMGCTEPIAVALAAAKARDVLGCLPEYVCVEASGSIIKNVKSVIVPNTNNRRGIGVAAAIGIVGGKAEKLLEVIADVQPSQEKELVEYLDKTPIEVKYAQNGRIFDIIITVKGGGSTAKVRIADYHTNFVYVAKNEQVILDNPPGDDSSERQTDRSVLSVESIWDFAMNSDLGKLKDILADQVQYNMAIAREGLTNSYGSNIGKTILKTYGDQELRVLARASAAAGSDARMNGCEMPVVINSGSGNQGITASVPVIVYANGLNAGEEQMYRALALSNLLAIHQKTGIGTLSAYCGAVSAGIAAGCGIAFLLGGDLRAVKHTLENAVVITSGMICDGAKASCAAKIAMAVESGLLGYDMFCGANNFKAGDGIMGSDVEKTIQNVGRLASEGMKETNDTIINIMVSE